MITKSIALKRVVIEKLRLVTWELRYLSKSSNTSTNTQVGNVPRIIFNILINSEKFQNLLQKHTTKTSHCGLINNILNKKQSHLKSILSKTSPLLKLLPTMKLGFSQYKITTYRVP